MAAKCMAMLMRVCSKKVIIPSIVWFLYLGLGAYMFSAIEGDKETSYFKDEGKWLEEVLREAIDETEDLYKNLPFPDECISGSKKDLMIGAVNASSELRIKVQNLTDKIMHRFHPMKSDYRWDMTGGIHFCLTVLSTIGYGLIVPRTQKGRLACIVYASIGIPLNIVFLAGVGRVLAHLIDCSYRRWLLLFGCAKACKESTMAMNHRIKPNSDGKSKVVSHWNPISKRVSSEQNSEKTGTQCNKLATPRAIFTVAYSDWSVPSTSRPEQTAEKAATMPDDDPRPVSKGNEAGEIQRVEELPDKPVAPLWYVSLFITTYMTAFILLLHFSDSANDDWSFIDLCYYEFITFSTIGFGDLYLKPPKGHTRQLLVFIDVVVVIIGMASLSAVVNIVASTERLDKAVTWALDILLKIWNSIAHAARRFCQSQRSGR
ncbi:potassium channel subfamily K member 18-like [Diadema antillarum]|uniref:potassium channel subfamily K member 18-like n=1 Tax=Diadema antillarum TaxID=105358 RepID=UPI003A8583C9